MELITSRSLPVLLGIALGIIFFGIHIAIINYNRLVVPEHPLALVEWQQAGNGLEINLLGEKTRFTFGNEHLEDSIGLRTTKPENECAASTSQIEDKIRQVSIHVLNLYDLVRETTKPAMAWVQDKTLVLADKLLVFYQEYYAKEQDKL